MTMQTLLLRLTLAVAVVSAPLTIVAGKEPEKNSSGTKISIEQVNVSRERTTFNLSYSISLGENVKWARTELLISTDGGETWSGIPAGGKVSGDIGRIGESGQKLIKYDFSRNKEELAGKKLAFKVNVKSKDVLESNVLAMASASVFPQMSYGLMGGWVRKFGGYAKVRTDFNFPGTTFTCDKAGNIEGGGTIWTSGKEQKARFNFTAGVLFRASHWLYPYTGLGYGSRTLCWEDYQGQWAKVSDYSCSGVSLEIGAIFKLGKFAVSAGVSNTAFKYTEVEIGLGVMF